MVDLQKAIRMSLPDSKHIRRKNWDKATVYVSELFIGQNSQGMAFISSFGKVWHPSPEDILAEDWELVEKDMQSINTEPQESLLPARKNRTGVVVLVLSIMALAFSMLTIVWR